MSSDFLGFAVVGLGVGRQHALAYTRIPGARVVWLYDRQSSKSREIVDEIGQGRVADDYETILSDKTVDGISIASFDDAHYEQVVAALNAGKHVFVEKPLCRSIEELEHVRKLVLAHPRLHLASNLVLRAAPLYRWLKSAVQAGELGDIYAFDGDYLYGRLQKITEGWRRDVDNYSVMQGGGIHMVDLMLWITGQKPRAVSGVGNQICCRSSKFRYNDFMAATYSFDSGMIGRITANFGSVHKHQHVVRIFGTKSTFIHDDAGARLHLERDPGAPPRVITHEPLPASKGALIPDFVEGIRRRGDPRSGASHELAVVQSCIAADQAVAGGDRVMMNFE